MTIWNRKHELHFYQIGLGWLDAKLSAQADMRLGPKLSPSCSPIATSYTFQQFSHSGNPADAAKRMTFHFSRFRLFRIEGTQR
jgi:hypothetical protein